MPARHLGRDRQVGQVGVEIDEGGAGDVPFEVAVAGARRVGEVVAAVGEADVHGIAPRELTPRRVTSTAGQRCSSAVRHSSSAPC